jgi:hypothetical protein
MNLNGSGIRDTARVLKISTATVVKELKKRAWCITAVNQPHDPQAQRRTEDIGIALAK